MRRRVYNDGQLVNIPALPPFFERETKSSTSCVLLDLHPCFDPDVTSGKECGKFWVRPGQRGRALFPEKLLRVKKDGIRTENRHRWVSVSALR